MTPTTAPTRADMRQLASDALDGLVDADTIMERIDAYVAADHERIAQAIDVESRGSRLMVTRHVLEIVRADS